MIKTQFNNKIRPIRSDNCLEFTSNRMENLKKSKGTLNQYSCSYIPEQNNKIEKKNKNLINIVKTLKLKAQISLKF